MIDDGVFAAILAVNKTPTSDKYSQPSKYKYYIQHRHTLGTLVLIFHPPICALFFWLPTVYIYSTLLFKQLMWTINYKLSLELSDFLFHTNYLYLWFHLATLFNVFMYFKVCHITNNSLLKCFKSLFYANAVLCIRIKFWAFFYFETFQFKFK